MIVVVQVRVDGERGPVTLSMIFDNSQRRAAELASRHVQARLRNLVAASPDCILLAAIPSGRVLLASERFEALTGYACAEIVDHTVVDIGIWRDKDAHARFRAQISQHGSVSDFASEFIGKNSAIKQITMSASAFEFDGQRYVVTLARDVTENERARREQQAILATAAVGIAMTAGNRITRVNTACERIFGYPPGAMEGLHGSALWPPQHAPSVVQIGLVVH